MKKIVLLVGVLVVFAMGFTPTQAATEAEIEQAIEDGVAWLAAQQEGDGSWPSYWEDVATTGLALLKLSHRAYELGFESPFDPAYPYHQNVEDGFTYLFDATATRLLTVSLSDQDHTGGASGTVDDPDINGNGIGVYAHGSAYPFDAYDTGIVLAAISVAGTPGRVINVPGSVVDGWTYGDVAQDMVEWLAWAQSDFDYAPHSMGEGGWSYGALDNDDQMGSYGPDNSNGGYAVLGLAYAQQYGYTIPAWVKTELNAYIDDIQDPVDGDVNGYDGGSWYDAPDPLGSGIKPNMLKAGNLINEMILVGDSPATQRVIDALDYLARHWGDASGANWPPGWDGNPAQYQTMFTVMKGLEYAGIDEFSGIDWYAEFADSIVSQQSGDGSWRFSSGRGDSIIVTEWALLVLEKTSPVSVIEVALDIKPTSCPNPFNITAQGKLPVAILGTEVFDVMTVDPATVELEGVPIFTKNNGSLQYSYEDVATPFPGELCDCWGMGPDGYMDMVMHFDRQAIATALGAVADGDVLVLTLTGATYDGTPIEGADCVVIRAKGGAKLTTSVPNSYALSQNHPNPFNPETEISYALPTDGMVTLEVYNLLGHKVATLVQAHQAAGTYAVQWNADNVPSGVYFYRMSVNGFTATKRMVLMK